MGTESREDYKFMKYVLKMLKYFTQLFIVKVKSKHTIVDQLENIKSENDIYKII